MNADRPPAVAGLILVILLVLAPGCLGNPAASNAGGNGSDGCRPGYTGCPSGCADLQRDVFNCGSCGSTCDQIGYLCQKGVCGCEPGSTDCDGECVNLQLDDSYCGSCHNFCTHDETCSEGVCIRK